MLSGLSLVPAVLQGQVQYFQQEVNYTIHVKLDDVKNELFADASIEYINNSPDDLSFIYFHLWPNAYKNNSTALAKQILESGSKKFYYASEEDRGYIDGLRFMVDGKEVEWEYDSSFIDICKIKLNEPLPGGGRITITTPFHVKIPKGIFSRLGHMGQSYQITQWYPKPAVYDRYGWHQMPYLNQGEFYSEFGSFDVSITLPKNYVVGATGDMVNGESETEWLNYLAKETEKKTDFDNNELSFPPSSPEMKTLRYKQNRVHDFAWFADKRYHVLKGEVELPHSKRKVSTWAMFTNNEANLWKKSIEYLNDAVYYYSLWNGDYPYNHATAVDGALSAGGGMEYPNITVIGESRTPFLLEMVIMHEVGHNWFYGILGSNEREHPWLDEGINSFNESRYIRTKYPGALILGLPPDKKIFETFDLVRCKAKYQYYLGYLYSARMGLDQPIELPSEEFSEINYGTIVYYKTALVFDYLMAYLEEETFDKAMQKYFETWKFKHPYPEDLRKILEEETGKNLSWFFDDVINSAKKLDYKIVSAKKSNCPTSFTGDCTEVTVENTGEIAGPFSISAIKNDSVISTTWFEGFQGKQKVNVFFIDFDRLTIDGNNEMPEINQRNNTTRMKGIFKKVEPIKPQFIASIENPEKTQLFYVPMWGWNYYDKNMLGLAFFNNTFPQKNFEYMVSPMYSFEKKSWVGFGNVFYNWFPSESRVQNAKMGINASGYDFMDIEYPDNPSLLYSRRTAKFYKVSPEINILFRKKNARSSRQKSMKARMVNITTENTRYFRNSGGRFKSFDAYTVNEISFSFDDSRTMNPWGFSGLLQGGENFVKSSLEVNHRFEYSGVGHGKGFDFRLFAGKFILNKTKNPYINWRMDGQNGVNDYTFDQIFLGRTETDGILSQQFIENHGAFKAPTSLGQSNNWICALNIKMELPFKLPLGLFADAGIYPNSRALSGVGYMYDAGIHAWLARGFCDLYIPLFYSEDIGKTLKARGLNFGQTIRFSFNISKMNPSEMMGKVSM